MLKKTLLIFVITFIFSKTFSQNYTISGYVRDNQTGENLIGVNVYDLNSLSGTTTNVYGFFSLTLPKSSVKLVFSYVGYQTVEQEIELTGDLVINPEFTPAIEIEEVKISAVTNKVDDSQMSSLTLSPRMIESIPVLFGETDLIKTIQLMPGVQGGSEGSSSFYVRGGGPDQNLILLDGVPVYNVNHLFGFFSVFNSDAVQNVSLIKGGFPARYGGRLSSVLDIRLKEGNRKEYHGEGTVGLISSKFTFEGPIIKDKSSFIVSARRTYIDVLARPVIKMVNKSNDVEGTAGYFFHDLNGKVNYSFSDKSRLYASVYTGKDKAYFKDKSEYHYGNSFDKYDDEAGLWWGNITGALRWNYEFNNKLFSNTTLTYSRYKFTVYEDSYYETNNYTSEYAFNYFSGINDLAANIDFDYLPTRNHHFRFGGNLTSHTFHPGVSVLDANDQGDYNYKVDTTYGNTDIFATEFYTYVEDDFKIGSRLKLNLGIHYSGFNVRSTFYQSLQPRASLRLKIAPKFSFKAAYSQMTQYIHLLTNSGIGLPTDMWVPVTDKIKPMHSTQYAAGLVYGIADGIDASIEGFYKQMGNMIDYKEGASYFSIENGSWEDKLETGKGWAYGGEVLLEKKTGKFTGWVGYTLSWANRQFDNISFGEVYPASYDRRHDIGLAFSYDLNERIDLGMVWIYGTGSPVTLAFDKYASISSFNNTAYSYYGSQMIEHYSSRNNYRMIAYHRLDLGINFTKEIKIGKRVWAFGLYNSYNRQNPFYLFFDYEYFGQMDPVTYEQQYKKVLKQMSLFPLLPFASYSIKF